MGWSTMECDYDESTILEAVSHLKGEKKHSANLAALGYRTIMMGDCWQQQQRSFDGSILPDIRRFPAGVSGLAQRLHSSSPESFRLSVYTSQASLTPSNRPGSFRHEYTDLLTFCNWGVDAVYVDHSCDVVDSKCWPLLNHSWALMHSASEECVHAGGNKIDIVVNGCGPHLGGGMHDCGQTVAQVSDAWLVSPAFHSQSFEEMMDAASDVLYMKNAALPGTYNLPGSLLTHVTQPGQAISTNELKIQFSLWAMLSAPLILRGDLGELSQEELAVVSNIEVIAVNQCAQCSPAINQTLLTNYTFGAQLLVRDLSVTTAGESGAVLMINNGNEYLRQCFDWKTIGLNNASAPVKVRNLWTHQDLGMFTKEYCTTISPRDMGMLRYFLE
jgi:alpha-galactosidase